MLIDDLIASLPEKEHEVKEVRVGYLWIGVVTKNCGLAKNYGGPYTPAPAGFGNLEKLGCAKLLSYARSWNFLEAGIGIATLNSLIDVRGKRKNAFDIIREVGRNKRIVMVGHFPDAKDLRKTAKEVWVLERNPQPGDLPDTAAEYLIPKADVVAITGSAIINKSLERLLELSRGKFTVILGPSTPMSEVLFDYGADVLAGVRVKNPAGVMRKISQGGGMVSQLKGDVEFRVMEK
ncbi:MAG: Rossmann-like domain-containing protein [Candidatus Hadarchaeum sp.]|uniref:Rossmann-like domain-containing protein n=1 Tax=Candidatus Hadarchaeum sp. TaxID=2883567 RepID=UPI003D13D189